MTRSHRRHYAALVALCALSLGAGVVSAQPAPDAQKLAILALSSHADLSELEIKLFFHLVHSEASRVASGQLIVIPQPDDRLPEPCSLQCKLDLGQRLGVDYLIAGEITHPGEGKKITLWLHSIHRDEPIAVERGHAPSFNALQTPTRATTQKLLSHLQDTGRGPLKPTVVTVTPQAHPAATAPTQAAPMSNTLPVYSTSLQATPRPVTLSSERLSDHGGIFSGTLKRSKKPFPPPFNQSILRTNVLGLAGSFSLAFEHALTQKVSLAFAARQIKEGIVNRQITEYGDLGEGIGFDFSVRQYSGPENLTGFFIGSGFEILHAEDKSHSLGYREGFNPPPVTTFWYRPHVDLGARVMWHSFSLEGSASFGYATTLEVHQEMHTWDLGVGYVF